MKPIKKLNKMTAVEFLKQNIPSLFLEDSGHYAELFKQALELEKQQIINAYIEGYSSNLNAGDSEKYYEHLKNETK
jgi:hypothetical protein